MPVEAMYFERWLQLFDTTVDAYFEGPMADDAKKRALIMATNFARRIHDGKEKDKLTLV
jgi:hemoglobin